MSSVFLGLYLLTLERQFIWLYSEMCQKQLPGLNAPNGFKHPLRKWNKKNSYTRFPFLTGNLFSIGKEQKREIKFSSLQQAEFCLLLLFLSWTLSYSSGIYWLYLQGTSDFEQAVHLGNKPNGMQTANCSIRETNSVHFQSLKLKSSELWIGTAVQGFEFHGAGWKLYTTINGKK